MSESDRLGGDIELAQALVDNGVVIAQTGTTSVNRNAVPRGIAKIGDHICLNGRECWDLFNC